MEKQAIEKKPEMTRKTTDDGTIEGGENVTKISVFKAAVHKNVTTQKIKTKKCRKNVKAFLKPEKFCHKFSIID